MSSKITAAWIACLLRLPIAAAVFIVLVGAGSPRLSAQTFGMYRELWTNLNASMGNTLAVLTNAAYNPRWPASPAAGYTKVYANFETEANTGMDNYGQRARAFVVPPVTGPYTFWIASDDNSQLFLSSGESPANKSLIAQVAVWTDPRVWTSEAGQKSPPVILQAGQRYYLEAIMQQGGGGDNLAVRWQLPNGVIEEPMAASSSAGTRLIPCGSAVNSPGIFTQPTDASGLEGSSATFSLLSTNQSPMAYQWLVNGQPLGGSAATQPVLVISNLNVALNDSQIYRCIVSNTLGSLTSSPARLTVIRDTMPPAIVFAGNSGLSNVVVRFSKPVEPASATNIVNYALSSGATCLSASLYDASTVTLLVTPLQLGGSYTVTISQVRDRASLPNTIAPNSQFVFTALAYGLAARPPTAPFLNNQLPEAQPQVSGNWSAVVAYTNLLFTNALGIANVPGTANMVVWEREGRMWQFANDPAASTKTLVFDLSNQCQGWDDSGLLNVAFHPGFATNRYVFVYYTWVAPGTVQGSPTARPPTFVTGAYHDRLSRFTLDASGVAVPGSETVFIDQTGDSVWHNGSGMFFHPTNGFLYVCDGDDENGANTQVINNQLFSGVWRIDVDQRGGSISHAIVRRPTNATTANYFIPNDNPFVGQTNALEEFYALGLRSPHRMTCDPVSGRIFIGDVGEGMWEELDVIEPTDPPGLNFQWNRIEGLNGDLAAPYPGVNKRPIMNYDHGEGQAIIGGNVYRGAKFAADLGGKYIFGDNVQKKVWVLDETSTPAGKILLCIMPTGSGPNSGSDYTGLSSFGLDQNNELYFCQMSSVGGHIYTLARTGPPPASRPLPKTLSQTGAFKDTPHVTPSDTLVPYTVNSALWSDAAVKHRWLSVPTNTFIHFAPTGEWTFPNGTVFVKHFELPVDDTNPSILRRLETRILVRDTNGTVYGTAYKWRSDNSDADILTNALSEDIAIATATGTRTQTWFYPGQLDCLRCHNPAAGFVLGPKTRQLNCNFTYPSGASDNQLRTFSHVGLFDVPLDETAIPSFDKLTSVTNTAASLTYRVRSYLDANCAQCHRPGGAPAVWDARFDTPLVNQGIVNGAVGNTLGITGGKVVVPQDLARSIMYQRMNSVDPTRKMPPLARNTIDTNAVSALAAWITGLSLPFISPIPDLLTASNTPVGPVSFTVGDATVPATSIVLSASSSNTQLIPKGNIVFGGSGSNRTVTITPAPGQFGGASITVIVNNGLIAATESLNVTVTGALVAWYKFEGDVTDSSGQGNNGVAGGTTTFVAGKVGTKALNFDGTSGYVQIPVSIQNDFSVALWVKTTATAGGDQWWAGKGLVDGEVAGAFSDFGLALVGNKFGFGIGNPDTTITSTSALNDGNWHHLVATRNNISGRMALYVDGSLQVTNSGPTGSRTGPPTLRIGSIQTGVSGGFLNGVIDDVRLYNYELAASQVAALANTPPMLQPIANQTVMAGRTLTVTNSAFDVDQPVQALSYSLVNPPAGAGINLTSGQLSWRPTITQGGTTNLLTVKVSDSGTPTQSAVQSFYVSVLAPARPTFGVPAFNAGKLQLLISGDSGPDYSIQTSSNLFNWVPLFTTNQPIMPFLFLDPAASNFNARFYRIQLGP